MFIVLLYFSFAASPSITEPPNDVTVNQGEPATFTCTAAGSGDLTIQWNCSDGSNCGQSSQSEDSGGGTVTSTLVITGASTNLNVTCVVNQSLASFLSGESGIEARLPLPTEVLTANCKLIVIPAPTTATPQPESTPIGEIANLHIAQDRKLSQKFFPGYVILRARPFITPCACASGKVIGLYVCRRHRCRHENHQILSSRHLCVL